MHQMAQEGAQWPSVITLEPCWYKVKLNWANNYIANGSSTIGFYSTRKYILILLSYNVTS